MKRDASLSPYMELSNQSRINIAYLVIPVDTYSIRYGTQWRHKSERLSNPI